ncbi:MAG: hypothetical protein ACYC8T_35975, partial [Myxococcaceae bacterium]
GNLSLGEFQLLSATGSAGPDLLIEKVSSAGRGALLFPNGGRGFEAPRPVSPMVASGLRPNPFGALGLSANRCAEGLCLTRWAQGLPQESSFMSVPEATPGVSAAGSSATYASWACGEFNGQRGPDFLTYRGGRFFAAYGVAGRADLVPLGADVPAYGLSARWSLPFEADAGPPEALVDWRRYLVQGRFGAHGALAVVLNRAVTFVSGGTAPAATGRVALLEDPARFVRGVQACDVDADGTDDLVVSVGSFNTDYLQVVQVQDGSLSLGQKVDLSGLLVTSALAGQFTRDRYCDVLLSAQADSSSPPRPLFLAGAASGLAPAPQVATEFPSQLFDFNGDGLDDLFRIESYDDTAQGGALFSVGLKLRVSNGDGSFTPHSVPLPEGSYVTEAAFRRADDGRVEALFYGTVGGKAHRLWRATLDDYALDLLGGSEELPGVGDEAFFAPGLVGGDLNGDGQLDAVSTATSQVFVARSQQLVPEEAMTGPEASAMMLLDLNGDHLDDLVYLTPTRPLRLGVLFNHSH